MGDEPILRVVFFRTESGREPVRDWLDEIAIRSFHKFSVAVWVIWLIPYLSGAVFGMTQ
jgi:hypothetical protein